MIPEIGANLLIDPNTTGVKFQWDEFTSGLVESVANFVLKGWADGGVSGIASLAKTFIGASMEEPAQARAWRLITICFAWSLDDIKGKESLDVEHVRPILRSALDNAKSKVNDGDYQINAIFFENPATSSLYIDLRETVVSRRVEAGIKASYSDDELRSKLDQSFTLATLHVWSADPKVYNTIAEHIVTPLDSAAERTLNWRQYKARLVHDFEVAATFGQEKSGISLSQVYVALRGYWEDESGEPKRERNSDGRLPRQARGVWLDEALDAWSTDYSDDKDWLRLIGGGPGSGKSTTLRALSVRLAKLANVRPLLIPLQHIGVGGDLRASINNYFTQVSGAAFTHEPLSRRSVEVGLPLVLIFDGLDELVAPNESAKETISLFVHKLSSLIHELKGEANIPVRVVVSGRMLAFQAARRLLTLRPEASLEVYGFLPASLRGLAYEDEIWAIDQRPLWWTLYATAIGTSTDLPQAFSAKELDSITHEPLLAYLLVLAGFSSHNWERAAENPNRIYATLMSDIYSRGWGEAAVRIRNTTSNEFLLLMQTIGLAAWLGGDTRVASEASVLSTIELTRAQSAWQSFNDDHGPDVTNLAMNFYLKASDKAGRGFEFTHKSFGEYLAALAILEVAMQVRSMPRIRMEYALQEWFSATGSGTLTSEILEFIRREVRLRWQEGDDDVRASLGELKSSFESIAEYCITTGFPLASNSSSWRVAEKRQINAEATLWAVINAVVRASLAVDRTVGTGVCVPALRAGGLRPLLMRHTAVSGFTSLLPNCLTAIVIDDAYVTGLIGANLDLSYSKASHIIFEGSYIVSAVLEYAQFGRMAIYNSNVYNSNFKGAVCHSVSIIDSNIKGVEFDSIKASQVAVDEETLLTSVDVFSGLNAGVLRLIGRGEEHAEVDAQIARAIDLIAELRQAQSSRPENAGD